MDAALKKTIEEALRAACAPEPAEVLLEDAGSGRVGGQVISQRFDGMKPSERQDLIWAHLDAHLTRHDTMRVSFIVADTPAERAALVAESRAG